MQRCAYGVGRHWQQWVLPERDEEEEECGTEDLKQLFYKFYIFLTGLTFTMRIKVT